MRLAAGLCAFALSLAAFAQDYPAKRIQYIVPSPAAGPNDFIARLLSDHLSKALGQPVIVENRAGGSATIGTEFVARQPADGHTLLHITATHVLNPSFMPKLGYDPIGDFNAVTQAASMTFMLTVHSELGVKDVREYIARARANPGKLTYATVGVGSSHHLAAEMLKSMTGIDLLHIPYKGGAQITQALLAREVDSVFISIFPVRKLVLAGTLRGLGVTTSKRATSMPDVPTVAEAAGLPGFEMDVWQGIGVRSGTPRPIITRLNREFVAALKDPQNAKRITELGLDPVGSTPEYFDELMKAELARWSKLIKQAGIKVQP
jgi:tripartite-type tricarboxylate transporter receptor subunit TctC